MNIGILTLNLNYNYGGILQAYALYTVIKNMGHTPLLIQRKRYFSYWANLRRLIGFLLNRKTSLFEGYISSWTCNFVDQYIDNRTSRLSNDELRLLCKDQSLNVVIVGSDQVWRKWGDKLLASSFLDFCENDKDVRRIAYGVSFGVDKWLYSDDETRTIKYYLRDFKNISCRESSGVELCSEFLKMKTSFVLDPTMLLSVDEYKGIIASFGRINKERQLVYYFLDATKGKVEYAMESASEMKLNPYNIGVCKEARMLNMIGNPRKCIWPTVESWLSGICYSRFVVTDSFHGVVFSILFHRPFVCLDNQLRGSARIHSLLDTFDLRDRLVSLCPSGNVEYNLHPIDWESVDQKLESLRSKSIHFLVDSLS